MAHQANQFGRVTQQAMQLIKNCKMSPVDAWTQATSSIPSTSSRAKLCPKRAFLGLCEEGLVKGIPKRTYFTDSCSWSKPCAVAAIALIRVDSKLLRLNPTALMKKVCQQLQILPRQHEGEMDVVLALWNCGYIIPQVATTIQTNIGLGITIPSPLP